MEFNRIIKLLRKERGITQKHFGVQPSGLKVSALLASMMPCSAFPLSAGIFVVIFLRSSKNLCHF